MIWLIPLMVGASVGFMAFALMSIARDALPNQKPSNGKADSEADHDQSRDHSQTRAALIAHLRHHDEAA